MRQQTLRPAPGTECMAWAPHSETLACALAHGACSAFLASLLPNDFIRCQGPRRPRRPAGGEVQCVARGRHDFDCVTELPKGQAGLQQMTQAQVEQHNVEGWRFWCACKLGSLQVYVQRHAT